MFCLLSVIFSNKWDLDDSLECTCLKLTTFPSKLKRHFGWEVKCLQGPRKEVHLSSIETPTERSSWHRYDYTSVTTQVTSIYCTSAKFPEPMKVKAIGCCVRHVVFCFRIKWVVFYQSVFTVALSCPFLGIFSVEHIGHIKSTDSTEEPKTFKISHFI